jgi:NitT/TauT family transport system substrate-binding protein
MGLMNRRLALMLPMAGIAAPRRAAAQAARERIRLVSTPTEGSTNVFYAIKSGMFARAGLAVDMTGAGSGNAATTAVIAGSYEMGKTTMVATFTAHLRNIPLVLVAPGLVWTPRSRWALLQVPTDSPLKTGADLNGKTIGVTSLGDMTAVGIKAWVEKNGGDVKSLKFVEVPNSATEAALQQHRIDAAILQSPNLDASLTAGTTKTMGDALGAIAPSYLVSVWVARRDWAEQHQAVLARFKRVFADATTYVDSHPTETIPYVAELTSVDRDSVAKMPRSVSATSLDPSLIQPMIDAAAKYGAIERTFPARELLV